MISVITKQDQLLSPTEIDGACQGDNGLLGILSKCPLV